MSSLNTSAIDVHYPVPGVNNNSQGFRDNFTSIKNNLDTTKTELTDLQSKVLLKSGLSGTTLDNNLAGALISNASVRSFRTSTYNLGAEINDVLIIDVTKGDVQYGTITGDTTISFAGWSPTGTQSSVQLNLTIDYSQGYKIYLPSSQYNSSAILVGGMDTTVSLLENYYSPGAPGVNANFTNEITAAAGVKELQFKFTTVNCGATLTVFPLNRSRLSSYIGLRYPGALGSPGDAPGAICTDGSFVYICVDTYDGTTPIWGKIGDGIYGGV